MNLMAVTDGVRVPSTLLDKVRAFIVLMVTNFQSALEPSGVSHVFQVRSTIVPSRSPVARTPVCEYSRSWKAKHEIEGGRCGGDIRSKDAIALALMVCK
jgi:hypothetical protein